jgi:NAD(P)-dependent dehydrogenase (short-subunit alcohol dehydrogenase family)
MEKVLITGTSCGVGRAAAMKFLDEGYMVYGLDWKESTIVHTNYKHYQCDVGNAGELPAIRGISYLVNNAGIVTPKADAIRVNQQGYINVIKTYGYDTSLRSIVNVGSTASIKGYDNLEYCSSQGARDAITKWAANNFGKDDRHVIVNGLNLDGIVAADPEKGIQGTSLEPELYAHPELMEEIANLSILKKLATVEEIAEWIYFLLVKNTVMTGQIINIDGELMGAFKFIPYPGWND